MKTTEIIKLILSTFLTCALVPIGIVLLIKPLAYIMPVLALIIFGAGAYLFIKK